MTDEHSVEPSRQTAKPRGIHEPVEIGRLPRTPTCLVLEQMSPDRETSPSARSPSDVLREMWTNRRREAELDLELLCSTLESLVHSPSDSDVRARAQTLAHQLAGVFGIFGFTESKAQMARIDIELTDSAIPIETLLVSARETLASLP